MNGSPDPQLFDDVRAFLTRYVAYPSPEAADAHALWIGHAWLMDQWDSTPRIAFLSPEPGSGKSRALEVTEPLVPRPVHAVNATPAALFRKVSAPEGPPTILYDEIDTVFGPKAKDNEDIRGMLNAGHRRGATALRAVVRGHAIEVEEFPSYSAVALAGLNDLPDTIATRAVVIRMRRRGPEERVQPYRPRVVRAEAEALHVRLEAWAEQAVVLDWPEPPPGIEDRNADVWEALLAVADIAGGAWPTRARVAAVALVADARDDGGSVGVQLLRDIEGVFDSAGVDKMHTRDLLAALNDDDELPWGDWGGRPLDARRLSKMLVKYGIRPHDLRAGAASVNAKGYDRLDFRDAWSRYLAQDSDPHPPPNKDACGYESEDVPMSPQTSATSATNATELDLLAEVEAAFALAKGRPMTAQDRAMHARYAPYVLRENLDIYRAQAKAVVSAPMCPEHRIPLIGRQCPVCMEVVAS